MPHGLFLRLLELVRKELGADDARVELGGREPVDPRTVFSVLTDGSRLVVVFAEPPADRTAKAEQLERLVESFGQTLNEAASAAPRRRSTRPSAWTRRSRSGARAPAAVRRVAIYTSLCVGQIGAQRHTDDPRCGRDGERATVLRAGRDFDASWRSTKMICAAPARLASRASAPVGGRASAARLVAAAHCHVRSGASARREALRRHPRWAHTSQSANSCAASQHYML